jgi:hypothetical protein
MKIASLQIILNFFEFDKSDIIFTAFGVDQLRFVDAKKSKFIGIGRFFPSCMSKECDEFYLLECF